MNLDRAFKRSSKTEFNKVYHDLFQSDLISNELIRDNLEYVSFWDILGEADLYESFCNSAPSIQHALNEFECFSRSKKLRFGDELVFFDQLQIKDVVDEDQKQIDLSNEDLDESFYLLAYFTTH